MNTLESVFSKIQQTITIINFPTDILDILIVTFLIYKLLSMARTKSAAQIIKVVIFLLVLSYLSDALKLYALNYVVSKVIEVGLIALGMAIMTLTYGKARMIVGKKR